MYSNRDESNAQVAKLLDRLNNVTQRAERQWQACCPAHDDEKPSLSIALFDDGNIGVFCQAGCETSDVLNAIGMTMRDLMPPRGSTNGKPQSKREIEATYDYCDADGTLLFQVVRYDGKQFKQRRPKGDGWEWTVQGVKVVPYRLPELQADGATQLVFVVEGEKDVDRLRALGLLATCNAGGAGKWKAELSGYLAGRNVVIVPDNDEAGRKHAEQVARSLVGKAAEIKVLALPDLPEKDDVSDWLDAGGDADKLVDLVAECPEWTAQGDGADQNRLQALLKEDTIPADSPDLVDRLRERGFAEGVIRQASQQLRAAAGATGSRPSGSRDVESTADRLVELALARFRIGRSETDEAFAVENDGPNIAIMFRGSRDSLRAKLAVMYRNAFGRVPNTTALNDALNVLAGEALGAEPETTYLRLASLDNAIIIDMGDASGRCIKVRPGGWEVLDRSPVLFRRTVTTGVFPVPERGGNLADFRRLLNVSAESWPVLLGWQIAAFIPDIEHAILLLSGQQGTAKTTAAKLLINNFDPSPAEVRSQPRESEQWAVAAAGSWGLAIDNVSDISEWWSDALCRAVTGDAWLRRRLYTDGELVVLAFRRVVLLTSIDPGALRGDLGDRVLLVDLEPISEEKRRYKSEIDDEYKSAQPKILGALLNLLADVLAELPGVELERKPRMADFARVLAAMDRVLNQRGGWGDDGDGRTTTNPSAVSSLNIYMGQRPRIAETVVESDPVAMAVQSLFEEEGGWSGTTGELLARITPDRPPRDWPKSARALSGRLDRLAPALQEVGVEIDKSERTNRGRIVRIYAVPQNVADSTSTTVTPSPDPENTGVNVPQAGDGPRDGWPGPVSTVTPTVTPETAENAEENGSRDDSDGRDDSLQPSSDWGEV